MREHAKETKSGFAAAPFKCKACSVGLYSKHSINEHRKTDAHKVKEKELIQMQLEGKEFSMRQKQSDTLNF